MGEGAEIRLLEMLQSAQDKLREAERKNERLKIQHEDDQLEIKRLRGELSRANAVIENINRQTKDRKGMTVVVNGNNNGVVGEDISDSHFQKEEQRNAGNDNKQ